MYLSSTHIYDISVIPIVYYNTMVYETKDVVFFDFEDEYLDISPPLSTLQNDYESVEISESPTTKLSLIQSFILSFLSLVREFTTLIFTIIFRVSGGFGVLTVTAAGLATLFQEPVFLNCLSQIQYIIVESDSRYNRGNDCLSEIQDIITQKIVGKQNKSTILSLRHIMFF